MTKLGLLYYERIGVLLNHILTLFSVNLSVALSNERAVRGRQIILQSIPGLEISEERARAVVWWGRIEAARASRHCRKVCETAHSRGTPPGYEQKIPPIQFPLR